MYTRVCVFTHLNTSMYLFYMVTSIVASVLAEHLGDRSRVPRVSEMQRWGGKGDGTLPGQWRWPRGMKQEDRTLYFSNL